VTFINNLETPKFDFDDITLVPSILSRIESRSEINLPPLLPLVASPMNSVLSIRKKDRFHEEFLNSLLKEMMVCVPRNYEYSKYTELFKHSSLNKSMFKSISLQEFKLIETDFKTFENLILEDECILVDIANGHMRKLLDLSKLFIKKFPKKKLMIGNIANPYTYDEFSKIGVHYCRISIGSGSVCTSSSNAAIHYPMASLIYECNNIRQANRHESKIVADGGFKNFSDIIKSLALGSDYVMLGGILNKCLDSDSHPYLWKKIKITNMDLAKWLYKNKFPLYKRHVGMSTKEIQKVWGNKKLKTSEGIVKWNKVDHTLDGWVENFNDYLKSAMSYLNCANLEELKEKANFIFITENSFRRFHK
jgi:IMP dehydrogenase